MNSLAISYYYNYIFELKINAIFDLYLIFPSTT